MQQQILNNIISELRGLTKREVMFNTHASLRFVQLYETVFPDEKVCSTCTNKIATAYDKILSLTPETLSIMAQQNRYFLKDKSDLIDISFNPLEGIPTHITSANLTDTIAEKLIAANANYKERFIIKEEVVEETVVNDVAAKTKQQLAEMLKQQGIPFNINAKKEELVKLLTAHNE